MYGRNGDIVKILTEGFVKKISISGSLGKIGTTPPGFFPSCFYPVSISTDNAAQDNAGNVCGLLYIDVGKNFFGFSEKNT